MAALEFNVGRLRTEGKATSQTAIERRRDPRYVPGNADIYLGWWKGEKFRSELGKLRNFSAGGAAVDIDAELGDTDTVWLCAVGPGQVTWRAARLLGREGRVVRIQFTERLPYNLLELFI